MSAQILKDLSFFYPEIALIATFLVAIIADLIAKRSTPVVATVTMAGLLVSGALVLGQNGMHASIFFNMLAIDPFAFFFKIVILLSAILIVVFSLSSAELNSAGRKLGEYYALLVALTLGMVLMAGASNLLMMYLALELSSISS